MKKIESYPMNMVKEALAIYERRFTPFQPISEEIASEGINYLLDNELPEKIRYCLVLRYAYGFTHKQIGEVVGLSASRVGEILWKGIRLIAHPQRMRYIFHGCDYVNREKKLNEDLQRTLCLMRHAAVANRTPEEWLEYDLGELGFPNRAITRLKAYGIEYCGALVTYLSKKGFAGIANMRGLGATSTQQIFSCLQDKGIVGGYVDEPIFLIDVNNL